MITLLWNMMILGIIATVLPSAKSARLELTPDGFMEGVTDLVLVTCSPDGTGARAKEILVIEISKDGDTPIVHIQPPDRIKYGSSRPNHYQVQGLINNTNIPNSFLNLSIIYPSRDDVGTYTCVMSYIDEMGLVKQDTSSAQLTLNASDHSSVENRLRDLESAMHNLLERINDLEKDNDELQEENRNQSTQIKYLQEKADYTVAFSAAVVTETHISKGDVLVFSDVMINEGQGYNSSSGIFTAPRPGLYSFSLSIEIGPGGAVGEICLNVAGKDLVKMFAEDKDFGDQATAVVVSRLKAGDTAKAVVVSADGNSPRVYSERLSVFSGFLIKS